MPKSISQYFCFTPPTPVNRRDNQPGSTSNPPEESSSMQAVPSEPEIPQRSPLQMNLLARVPSQPKSKEEYFAVWDAWAKQPNQGPGEKRKKAVKRMKAWLNKDGRPSAKLDLGHLGLRSLPTLPTSLQKLDVSWNNLTSLPALQALTSLQELDASWNQLTDLPDLQALTSLQRLDVSNNKLTSLPALQALSSLQKLHVYRNKLTSLPPLQDLVSLQELNVSENPLTDMPPLPPSLLRLGAACCRLIRLPHLPALLSELDVSSNRLTSLPEPLSTIVQNGHRVENHRLKSINLKNNAIPEEQTQRLRELIDPPRVNGRRAGQPVVQCDESGRARRR